VTYLSGKGNGRGSTCLKEAVYHGVSWWDGADPAIRVPAGAKLCDQRFRVVPTEAVGLSTFRELEDVREGTQFVLARFGLSGNHGLGD